VLSVAGLAPSENKAALSARTIIPPTVSAACVNRQASLSSALCASSLSARCRGCSALRWATASILLIAQPAARRAAAEPASPRRTDRRSPRARRTLSAGEARMPFVAPITTGVQSRYPKRADLGFTLYGSAPSFCRRYGVSGCSHTPYLTPHGF